jgi:hypothetical protein
MLLAWSRYSSDPGEGRDLVRYMHDELVLKPGPGGRRVETRRTPAPEVLLGDADLLLLAIRATPFERRYRSCVMPFAASDVDVEAFNEGEETARPQTAGCRRGSAPDHWACPKNEGLSSPTGRPSTQGVPSQAPLRKLKSA